MSDTRSSSETATPIAWVVKWTTVHTPENASAYLNERDANRAAANVRMYAHASDVEVIPTCAAQLGGAAQPPTIPVTRETAEPTQYLIDQFREHGTKPSAQLEHRCIEGRENLMLIAHEIREAKKAYLDGFGQVGNAARKEKLSQVLHDDATTIADALEAYSVSSTSRGTEA